MVKDESKENAASNFTPIRCPPLMWKQLTGTVAEEIYEFLDVKGVDGVPMIYRSLTGRC